ncbi:MAG: Zn-ribbon domain-containing OB-fold protein [Ardenticatenaceae bacterium]|nr:Zn-ribbon domain-containing OB-fold protein [Ardenticatenaceae bacterium]
MSDGVRTIVEKWNLTYNHSAGAVASEFFDHLQRDGRLFGRQCPNCRRVLVPPRSFCDRCFVDTDRWVPVADSGVIEMFTIVYMKFQQLPDPPYAIAYVRLDGADTAILNYVKGLDLTDQQQAVRALKPGTRVRVAFAPDDTRLGSVLDFWFEPQLKASS